jgi:hypothetical protein
VDPKQSSIRHGCQGTTFAKNEGSKIYDDDGDGDGDGDRIVMMIRQGLVMMIRQGLVMMI